MHERLHHFDVTSNAHGIVSYSGEASGHDGPSNESSVSSLGIHFQLRELFTHGQRNALAFRRPKVGARCGKSARRVLSGGRFERAVPTGTPGGGLKGPSLPGLRGAV